ncbi:MAG TPA: hypothetical protein VMJ33_00565, partial [Gallionella sp.]|nr:hypothetical protein [Gallionella sp.]
MEQSFSGNQPFPALDENAILALTKRGEQALLEPGTTLSPAQLEALVLIGGGSTVSKILRRAPAGLSVDVLRVSLGELVDKKYVSANAG